MERGIIAAPGIIHTHEDSLIFERSLSAEEIRYYVLYWDKVVIPVNNLLSIGLPEEKELIASKAIIRPDTIISGTFSLRGADIAKALASVQSIVAQKYMEDKDVDWVLHQIGAQSVLPQEFSKKFETLRVEIYNTLPVPDGTVPIAEILEFKEKRRSEFIAFHESMDEIYIEILKSPDPSLMRKKVFSQLQSTINNINTLSIERFKKTRKYDLTAEINLEGQKIISSAAAGAVIDFYSSYFTVPLATIIGAISSMIKIKAKASYSFEPAKEKMKLSYLSHASKTNIIK